MNKDKFLSYKYGTLRASNKRRFKEDLYFSIDDFKNKFLDAFVFNKLFELWINTGKEKLLKPVIDRINCFKFYTLDNIQFLSWDENSKKGVCEAILHNLNRTFPISDKPDKIIVSFVDRLMATTLGAQRHKVIRDIIRELEQEFNGCKIEDEEVCIYCDGAGIKVNRKCYKCKGTGRIKKEEKVFCPFCNGGLTKAFKVCGKCKGQAYISKEKLKKLRRKR